MTMQAETTLSFHKYVSEESDAWFIRSQILKFPNKQFKITIYATLMDETTVIVWTHEYNFFVLYMLNLLEQGYDIETVTCIVLN